MRMIFPGYGPANATVADGRLAPEEGEEETFPREDLALQAAENAALHARVHLDAVGHVGHRARLGAYFVTRAQREHDRLHVIADDLVADHVMPPVPQL